MISVYCPKGVETGGPEALHQLVDSLRRQGAEAQLVAMPGTEYDLSVETYDKYDVVWGQPVDSIFDDVVVPEIAHHLLDNFNYATKYVWLLAAAVPTREDAIYLSQSEFAAATAREYGKKSYMLSDYTVKKPSEGPNRNRVVSFNANKGLEKHQAVLRAMPDVDWIPIQGISRDAVGAVLNTSSIYLDLGHHPGKDRLPREAAISGVVVLTGKEGSAGYHEDVPIQEKVDGNNVQEVVDKIHEILDNLEEYHDKQKNYRDIILNEKERFDKEVKDIFL